MEIRKDELLEMWAGLNRLAGGDHKVKFAYAIARNRDKIKRIIEAIQEATKPIPEYEEKRVELANEMCQKKPDSDEPIVLPDGQYIISDMASFNVRLDKIKAATGQDKKDEEVKALMKETEMVDFHRVPFETLPEEMAPAVLQSILHMVDEPAEDAEAEVVPIKKDEAKAE